jgi:hypothetical protein
VNCGKGAVHVVVKGRADRMGIVGVQKFHAADRAAHGSSASVSGEIEGGAVAPGSELNRQKTIPVRNWDGMISQAIRVVWRNREKGRVSNGFAPIRLV